MAKVFVHTTNGKGTFQTNQYRDFSRIPNVGEYFALSSDSDWFRVEIVVHCPFQEADCKAEIYAILVDHMEVKKPLINRGL